MYSQVESLITKYYFNETNKMPDWNKLHIFHAWGGSNKPGVYFNTANSIGIKPLNYMNVKNACNRTECLTHTRSQITQSTRYVSLYSFY